MACITVWDLRELRLRDHPGTPRPKSPGWNGRDPILPSFTRYLVEAML